MLGAESGDDSKIENVSFYTDGDFTDLCRGPHAPSTGGVGAFKLMRIAGAYWRGNEKNPQMQRLYGVAFATKDELDDYLDILKRPKNAITVNWVLKWSCLSLAIWSALGYQYLPQEELSCARN